MIPQSSTAYNRDHSDEMCHPTPLGVLGSPLSPQHFTEATFSSQSLLYESKKTDPVRLRLKLQVTSCCCLIVGRSPGFFQPLAEGTLQTRYRISTDFKMFIWVLQKKHRVRIWQGRQELWISTAISQIGCALLLSPETMGSAHGSARTVHMDTCKESAEELWHFSSGRVSCAWSTLESLKYPLSACWKTIHNKEEIEQRNDCNAFLLERPAAEAMSPGSSKNLCWTKGMEF